MKLAFIELILTILKGLLTIKSQTIRLIMVDIICRRLAYKVSMNGVCKDMSKYFNGFSFGNVAQSQYCIKIIGC